MVFREIEEGHLYLRGVSRKAGIAAYFSLFPGHHLIQNSIISHLTFCKCLRAGHLASSLPVSVPPSTLQESNFLERKPDHVISPLKAFNIFPLPHTKSQTLSLVNEAELASASNSHIFSHCFPLEASDRMTCVPFS